MAKTASPGTVGFRALTDIPLISLMGAEFSVGKRWWFCALFFEGVALISGLIAAAAPGPSQLILVASLIALVAALLGFLFQQRADRSRRLGEKARRTIIYTDGLGWPANAATETTLRRRFGWWTRRKVRGTKYPPTSYYESTHGSGAKRLLDHLQESVFFQAELSARMAGLALWATIVVALLAFVSVILVITTLQGQAAREIAAKALSSGVLFLITTRLGLLWWDYHIQDADLHSLDDQLESVRQLRDKVSSEDILPLAHEYDIAVLQAPSVPDIVYTRNRSELNALWEQRRAQRKKAFLPPK
jgi:hypothetical protein